MKGEIYIMVTRVSAEFEEPELAELAMKNSNSSRSCFNQICSHVVRVVAQYSFSIKFSNTTFFFFSKK